MNANRRDDRRVPLNCYLTEYVADRPFRALVTNLSERGLCVQRLLRSGNRESRVVQLEFELPGTGELLWAKGETCHDEMELQPFGPIGLAPTATLHSSGIRISAMAQRHIRLMRDYVTELRRRRMKQALLRAGRHAL